jgi:predicted AAA+ superfamily ATPase
MSSISVLKKTIADQQAELHEHRIKNRYIPRELGTESVREIFAKGPGLVVLQGVRRCGKSTFAVNCFNEKFVYINFDDERLQELQAKDLNNLLMASYELFGSDLDCFIFDEIQNIEGWELFATRLEKTKKIIITGSNANLLSKELATHLTGRYFSLTLYPFSFREFVTLIEGTPEVDTEHLSTKGIGQLRALLQRYLQEGGFPDVQKFGRLYSQTIYSDIIAKDILQRRKLRAPELFKRFSRYVISNYAQEISLGKLGKYLGVKDPHTTAKYLSYLEETYLTIALSRYFHKLKAQLVTNKKTYTIDSGLINTTAFSPTPSLGALFENIVFLELLRQRDYRKSFNQLYFWQGPKCEVDFLVRSDNRFKSALQVSMDLSNPQTLEREKKALLAVHKALNPGNYIIVNDSLDEILHEGEIKIVLVPLWKWLLKPDTAF